MPNKTIYIRRDDLELWDNLENKSQVISDLLNSLPPQPKVIKTKEDAEKVIKEIKSVTYKPTNNWGA